MRRQCKACPWKKSTDPERDIPGGYCATKHRNLKRTIADADMLGNPMGAIFGGTFRLMACHETAVGKELPCVGWLAHQLGPGNNLALRMGVINGQIDADFELVGEQHETFEDTLPK